MGRQRNNRTSYQERCNRTGKNFQVMGRSHTSSRHIGTSNCRSRSSRAHCSQSRHSWSHSQSRCSQTVVTASVVAGRSRSATDGTQCSTEQRAGRCTTAASGNTPDGSSRACTEQATATRALARIIRIRASRQAQHHAQGKYEGCNCRVHDQFPFEPRCGDRHLGARLRCG